MQALIDWDFPPNASLAHFTRSTLQVLAHYRKVNVQLCTYSIVKSEEYTMAAFDS